MEILYESDEWMRPMHRRHMAWGDEHEKTEREVELEVSHTEEREV